jgi:hypothetical protein
VARLWSKYEHEPGYTQDHVLAAIHARGYTWAKVDDIDRAHAMDRDGDKRALALFRTALPSIIAESHALQVLAITESEVA